MNTPESPMEREARLQAAAAQAERAGLPAGDPVLDRERLLLRALRREPAERLPADFARQVAARAQRLDSRAGAEDWLVTLLLGGFGVGALVYVAPMLATLLKPLRLQVEMPSLPWPMLAATAVAIGVAWAVDQGVLRLESRRH